MQSELTLETLLAEITSLRREFSAQNQEIASLKARLAAEGKLMIPITHTFRLEEWRTSLDLRLNSQPHGKLLLLTGNSDFGE